MCSSRRGARSARSPRCGCARAFGTLASGLGLLDVLSSDYVPVSLLHGAFCLHERIGLPLPAALATVSANPARRIGLHDRGAIAPGLRADLVRVRHRGDAPGALAVWRQGRRIA